MIIISPAKKQIESHVTPMTLPSHLDKTMALWQVMKDMSAAQLAKQLGVSEKIAHENVQRLSEITREAFTLETTTPAMYTYAGDVYRYLQADSLDDQDVTYAQKNLRIISAFYGPLRPLDGILPYRLEMISRLPGFKDLAGYWQKDVTDMLADEPILFNLASVEYAKTVDQSRIKRWVDISFLDATPKGYRVVAVNAKRMRGLCLQYMLKNRVEDPEQLHSFAERGYCFDAESSTSAHLIFKKN